MNIGIDIRPLLMAARTGVAEYTYELLDALFKIDKTNQYFLFCNATKEFEIGNEKWGMGNVHRICTKYPNKLFNASLQFFQHPRLDRVTIHESRVTRIDLWFSPNLGFTALSPKVRQILTIHDLSFEHFPDCYSFKRRLWHRALNPRRQCERADIILTPSESTRRDVIETYAIPESKVRVIKSGISSVFLEPGTWNLEQVKKKYQLPDKFILFLGTIEPRKNILGLIEAYKMGFRFQVSGFRLLIAGPLGWKYEPILKAVAETPGTRYIGYVAPADKPALYQLADLFVYPSLYEGFGFPVLEAMAAGTPVITSNRSSLPEVAGDAACLVNPLNTSEITRAMAMLTSDQELRQILIERGKRRAGEFQWGNSARELVRIFTGP